MLKRKLISTIEDVLQKRNFEEGVKYTIDAFFNFKCLEKNACTNFPFLMIKDNFKVYTNLITIVDHHYHLLPLRPHAFFLFYEDKQLSFFHTIFRLNLLKPGGSACFVYHKEDDLHAQIQAFNHGYYVLLPVYKLNDEYRVSVLFHGELVSV